MSPETSFGTTEIQHDRNEDYRHAWKLIIFLSQSGVICDLKSIA